MLGFEEGNGKTMITEIDDLQSPWRSAGKDK